MANSPKNSLGNVRPDMDITYPEHLSRLHRHSVFTDSYPKSFHNPRRQQVRIRRGNRYRTQPVTYHEIQEVDEETGMMENMEVEDPVHSLSASLSAVRLQLGMYRRREPKGAKAKNQIIYDDTKNTSDTQKNADQSNGIEMEDETRWTDHKREGSI